jgi:hypothetical protein
MDGSVRPKTGFPVLHIPIGAHMYIYLPITEQTNKYALIGEIARLALNNYDSPFGIDTAAAIFITHARPDFSGSFST